MSTSQFFHHVLKIRKDEIIDHDINIYLNDDLASLLDDQAIPVDLIDICYSFDIAHAIPNSNECYVASFYRWSSNDKWQCKF